MMSPRQHRTPGDPQVRGPAGRGVTLNTAGGDPPPPLLPCPVTPHNAQPGRLGLSQLPVLAGGSWGSSDSFTICRKQLSECKIVSLEVDVYSWAATAETARNTRLGTSEILNFRYIFGKNTVCGSTATYLSPAPPRPCKPWSSYRRVCPQHKLGGMEGEERSASARADKYGLC